MKILLLILIFAGMCLAQGSWSVYSVTDSGFGGTYISIAAYNGNPVISYYDIQGQDLIYAWGQGGDWQFDNIELDISAPGWSSLIIDDNNRHNVVYADNGFVVYEGWLPKPVEAFTTTIDGDDPAGTYISMGVSQEGVLGVTYTADDNDANAIQFAEYVDDHWFIQNITSFGTNASWSSFAYNSNDNPMVVYTDPDYNEVVFRGPLPNMPAAQLSDIDNTEGSGQYASMATKQDGSLGVTYSNSANKEIRYSEKSGSGWDTRTLRTLTNNPAWSSLIYDQIDRANVLFTNTDNSEVMYTGWLPTAPTADTSTVDQEGNVGKYISMAPGTASIPIALTYSDETNQNLKIAENNGSGWDISTIYSGSANPAWSALSIDDEGQRNVALTNTADNEVVYTGWLPAQPTAELNDIDDATQVGKYISMTNDGQGNPLVSYYDEANRDLKFAYNSSSGWYNETVSGESDVGIWNSISINKRGMLGIAYTNSSIYSVLYAEKPYEPDFNINRKNVTVLVHGYNLGYVGEDYSPIYDYWDDGREFVKAILEASGGGVVYEFDRDSLKFRQDFNEKFIENGLYNLNGETILVFNWAKPSNDSESGQAEAAAEALFIALLDPDGDNIIDKSFLDLDYPDNSASFHFIGHSRGAPVCSEVIQRLGVYGITVDYVTYLDPHDFNENDVTFDGLFHDPATQVWDNVKYADNYWQLSVTPEVPSGRPIYHITPSYEYNYELSNLDGFGTGIGVHGQVIDWYLGTIKPGTKNSLWYTDGLGQNTGFSLWNSLGGRDSANIENGIVNPADPINFDNLKPFPSWNTGDEDSSLTDFFMGNFDLTDLGASIAGWSYFGGDGDGYVQDSELVLDMFNESRTHNRFYIPKNASKLYFEYRVAEVGDGAGTPGADFFQVLINDTPVLDSLLLHAPTDGWLYYPINLCQFKNSIADITVRIDGGADYQVQSQVRIDNIYFTYESIQEEADRIVAGYYFYNQENKIKELLPYSDIEYNKLTHIIHSFVWPDTTELGQLSYDPDFLYPELINEAHAHNVKVLLAVGGGANSAGFRPTLSNPETRIQFIDNLLNFVDENNYDGVDIDWEHPEAEDINNAYLESFIKELDQQITQRGEDLALTMAVVDWCNYGYNSILNVIDWFNCMTYDQFGYRSVVSSHNAALYMPKDDKYNRVSVDSSMKVFQCKWGIPKNKIVMGIPFYGLQCTTSGYSQVWTKEDSIKSLPYYLIKPLIADGWERKWDNVSYVPYLLSNNRNKFITYDDELSVQFKAQYALDSNLRGVMMWSLGQDLINDQEVLLNVVSSTMNGITSIPIESDISASEITYTLRQNYPNPYNPSTTIVYSLPKPEKVDIIVYNVLGQKVAELVNRLLSAGKYSINFDGSNLSSGLYFYQIKAGQFVDVKKMLLIK